MNLLRVLRDPQPAEVRLWKILNVCLMVITLGMIFGGILLIRINPVLGVALSLLGFGLACFFAKNADRLVRLHCPDRLL